MSFTLVKPGGAPGGKVLHEKGECACVHLVYRVCASVHTWAGGRSLCLSFSPDSLTGGLSLPSPSLHPAALSSPQGRWGGGRSRGGGLLPRGQFSICNLSRGFARALGGAVAKDPGHLLNCTLMPADKTAGGLCFLCLPLRAAGGAGPAQRTGRRRFLLAAVPPPTRESSQNTGMWGGQVGCAEGLAVQERGPGGLWGCLLLPLHPSCSRVFPPPPRVFAPPAQSLPSLRPCGGAERDGWQLLQSALLSPPPAPLDWAGQVRPPFGGERPDAPLLPLCPSSVLRVRHRSPISASLVFSKGIKQPRTITEDFCPWTTLAASCPPPPPAPSAPQIRLWEEGWGRPSPPGPG